MCRAADKLFLINGFSPGHLIFLALSLKSNLTLCMSVNINKPLKPRTQMSSIVSHMVPGEKANLMEGTVSPCVRNRVRRGRKEKKKKRNPALPILDIHQHRAGSRERLCFQKPVNVLLLPRFILDRGILFFRYYIYILQPTLIHFTSTLGIVNRGSAIYVYCCINAF